MGGGQHGNGARYADRQAAVLGFQVAVGLAVGIQKHVAVSPRRRGFSTVVNADGPRRAVEIGHESPATETRALRLYETQHGLDRHRRIHRAAARPQHGRAGLARQRVGGDHHRLAGFIGNSVVDSVAGACSGDGAGIGVRALGHRCVRRLRRRVIARLRGTARQGRAKA